MEMTLGTALDRPVIEKDPSVDSMSIKKSVEPGNKWLMVYFEVNIDNL